MSEEREISVGEHTFPVVVDPTMAPDTFRLVSPEEAEYHRLMADEVAKADSLLGILARVRAASPGPWALETEQGDAEYSTNPPYPYAFRGPVNQPMLDSIKGVPAEYAHTDYVTEITDMTLEDAEFMAHARRDVPALVACTLALLDLVVLKDGPRDAAYEQAKPKAWLAAKGALAALTPNLREIPVADSAADHLANWKTVLDHQREADAEPSDG